MRVARLIFSAADIRRKLRAVSALAENAGATEHERANAAALKARLQQRLKDAGEPRGDWTDNAYRFGKQLTELRKTISPASPKGDWTDNAFQLGRWARNLRGSASPASPREDWTDGAFRLGRALRRGYKKWL